LFFERIMRDELETYRLLLRPPQDADAEAIFPLANNFAVAKNTISMPHPYTMDDARGFIARSRERRTKGIDYPFAVFRKNDMTLVGAVGVHPDLNYELGYWIGEPFWGKGYATEAARRVTRFAFEDLNAKEVRAGWYADNPASGRVLEKIGFHYTTNEELPSVARGCAATCCRMVLTRSAFARLEQTP
jgi:RimJ/RimL family protein N-acetyltransferase